MTRHRAAAATPGRLARADAPRTRSQAQGVDPTPGLSDAEVEARRAKYGPNKFADAAEGAALAGVPAPVPGPDADRAAGRGHRQPVPARASSRPASC